MHFSVNFGCLKTTVLFIVMSNVHRKKKELASQANFGHDFTANENACPEEGLWLCIFSTEKDGRKFGFTHLLQTAFALFPTFQHSSTLSTHTAVVTENLLWMPGYL